MNPYIEVKDRSINARLNYNDPDYDDSAVSLFHVFISQEKLKVLFTVEWKDPNSNLREFQVIKHDHLYLDGQDRDKIYPIGTTPYPGVLSADPSIVQELFSDNLDRYGIRLDKVTIHNHTFYESVNFTFTDPAKLDQLYDLINEACTKVKYSPGHLA